MAKIKSESKTRGILLLAFGHASYGKWAYNMARSLLNYNPDLKIHLAAEEQVLKDIDQSVFTSVSIECFPAKITGELDTAQCKMQLFDISPFDETIYLDVDGVALQDVSPLFDRIFPSRNIFFQVMDQGKITDSIHYMWGANSAVWPHFEIPEDRLFSTSQTSFVAFDKSDISKEFFAKMEDNYRNKFPDSLFAITWGPARHQPDELYYSVTAAQMNLIPDKDIQPVFFPREHPGTPGSSVKDIGEIRERFTILAMWGAKGLVKPFAKDWYDRLMHNYLSKIGRPHHFKVHRLYDAKFSGMK